MRTKIDGPRSIYALYGPRDRVPRYIGQSANPEKRHAGSWRAAQNFEFTPGHPLDTWLRTLPRPPRVRVLAVVEGDSALAVEKAAILAARRRWPGQLLNLHPWPPKDAPEWSAWERLSDADVQPAQVTVVPPLRRRTRQGRPRAWTRPLYAERARLHSLIVEVAAEYDAGRLSFSSYDDIRRLCTPKIRELDDQLARCGEFGLYVWSMSQVQPWAYRWKGYGWPLREPS